MLATAFAGLATLPGDRYGIDGLLPRLAVAPRDAEEVARVVAIAAQAGLAVIPWGGGTHQRLGAVPTRYDVALLMGGLDGLIDHSPGDLTITVQAGMTLARLQAILSEHHQFVPLEAEEPEIATIGGLLSAGVAGPLRFLAGTARDFTLWVEAVRADGTRVQSGAKVVKNVAGFDLPKLYGGSLGSAGFVTAVCFKAQPMPETRWTTLMGFYHLEQADELLQELASARLAPSLLTVVKGRRDWGTPYDMAPWVLAVGADGPEETTQWQVDRFLALGREANAMAAIAIDGEGSAEVRQALMTHRSWGAVRLKLAVLPDQVAALAGQLEALSLNQELAVFAEAGNGIVRAAWQAPFEGWREAAQLAEDLGGTWVLEGCPTPWKGQVDVWGARRGDWALMARMKAMLDPAGVLSPGRFIGG